MTAPGHHRIGQAQRHHQPSARVVGGLVLAVGFAGSLIVAAGGPSRSGAPAPTSRSTPLAPDGAFTTATGATSVTTSLRGRPTLLWFVAGGCASCAASIPAVAHHLDQLRADRVHVLTLGLWGAFPAGQPGVAELTRFGRSAAGGSISGSGWTWGMASRALSLAYDPSGTPDVYALIGPAGHVRYRSAVPVSTMPELLAAAQRLRDGTPAPLGSAGAPPASGAGCVGSNPTGGTSGKEALTSTDVQVRALSR